MGAKELGKGRAAYAAARVTSAEPRRVPGFSRIAAAREQAEREVAAHIAVAEALAAWEPIESWFTRLLGSLAESLDCQVGVLWVPRRDRLRPRAFWQAAGDLGEFKVMTLTSRLPRGAELPGQAWQQLAPGSRGGADGWGPPRWRAAVAAGFREAIAFPAIWAGEVIVVIELVSRDQPELTERLTRSLTAIGYVLGQFLAHRRGILDEHVITDRQVEILRLAAEGLSRRQIAERLVLSPNTVKTHFENSYARLGVNTRAAAVAEAIRLGWVD
jgi:DNA-binding CsgD family transcriptional regulator